MSQKEGEAWAGSQDGASADVFLRCHFSCTAFSFSGSTSILPKAQGLGCQEGAPCDHEESGHAVCGALYLDSVRARTARCVPSVPSTPSLVLTLLPPGWGQEHTQSWIPGWHLVGCTEPCPAGATTRQPGFLHVLLTPSVYRNHWTSPTESVGQCQVDRSSGKQGN